MNFYLQDIVRCIKIGLPISKTKLAKTNISNTLLMSFHIKDKLSCRLCKFWLAYLHNTLQDIASHIYYFPNKSH